MAANFPNITISIAHNQDGSDASGELSSLSLGFGLYAAWIFTAIFGATSVFGASTFIPYIDPITADISSLLSLSYLATCAIALLCIGLSNQLLLHFYVSTRAFISASALGCFGTLLIMLAGTAGEPFAIVAGICIGLGSSLMTVLWGTAYARYEFTTIILNSTLAIVIAVLVFVLLTHWIPAPISGILTAAIPIAVAFVLHKLTPVPYYARDVKIPIFHPLSVRKTPFVIRFGIPAMVLGFSLGTMRIVSFSGVLPAADLTSQLLVGAAACVSVIVIIATVAASRDESHWDSVFRVVVPIVACAIYCVPFLGSSLHSLACFVIVGGFICFEALVWIFYSDLSQEFRLSPIYVFGIGRGMILIGTLLSYVVFRIPFSGEFELATLSLQDCFFLMLVLVIGYALLPRKRDIRRLVTPIRPDKDNTEAIREKVVAQLSEHQPDSPASADAENVDSEAEENAHIKGRFHVRCEEIADRYLLSRRETEVMFLLAKGHNAAYIQDKLCISKSTAKTHINHIYRKLDIHTQQELLNMMEEEEPEPTPTGLGAMLSGSVSRHMKPASTKKK